MTPKKKGNWEGGRGGPTKIVPQKWGEVCERGGQAQKGDLRKNKNRRKGGEEKEEREVWGTNTLKEPKIPVTKSVPGKGMGKQKQRPYAPEGGDPGVNGSPP